MTTLADDLVPDQLWALWRPAPSPASTPWGRHRTIPDRTCFAAIVPWRGPPRRGGSCRRVSVAVRSDDVLASPDRGAEAGVFAALHLKVLDQSGAAGQLAWSGASVDTMRVGQARRIMWAQIRSIVASPGPSSTWSVTAAGCR